ncbi:hypothetical protein GCM10022381_02990 [Leifsonia kafniensis]|uniref:Uncharacterized protein n=1 Tax=Leifsonia kafniensis TaxID=475957 RepID=A0ABP7K1B5_9MICO
MAASTRSRVATSTLVIPFETRDTVCDDTPARPATSAIDGPRRAAMRVRGWLGTGGVDAVEALFVSVICEPLFHVYVNMLPCSYCMFT